jgi:hypothetical protein
VVQSIQRATLHQAIDQLPEDALIDLAKFIEFLQFKVQYDEPDNLEQEAKDPPSFNPVFFPEDILKGVDFSPEYLKEARKELWTGFGKGFE